jgi:soluble lytic murein transglycosylase
LIASVGLLLLLSAPPGAASSSAWRLHAEPRDAAEEALRDAAQRESATAAAALAGVSQQYSGTPASGLARLLTGLRLLEADRPAEALAHLTHADVRQCLLQDHAMAAVGRAQEALGQADAAARSFLAAGTEPSSSVVCTALPRAADLFARAGRIDAALPVLERVAATCPRAAPAALLEIGKAQLARGDRAAAALAFDRLDREHPVSTEAKEARARLAPLAGLVPARSPTERAHLQLERGGALLAAGRTTEAVAALRSVSLASLPPDEAALARVRLGRALLSRRAVAEGRAVLQKVPPDSAHGAEAAFLLARDSARRARAPEPFVPVADRFPGTPWGEEALLSLANHYQKDALDEAALPWWRRLASEYPDGRYVERAAWRTGWGDYRARRYEEAAQVFETTARLRPPSGSTAGFLYWAGRSRAALGQTDRARALLAETIQRYKYAYHGVRAQEALGRLGGRPAPPPQLAAMTPPPEAPLPEPRATRLHQLLLIDRTAEAAAELRLLPESPRVQATLAWIDWRAQRFRPAITAMKRAYPEWVGEAGDRLPPEVWRILFPLRYDRELRLAAQEEGLDPALVAALILQESSFDAGALSRAGARGLMQVMPATGRRIARSKGQRYRRAALHDPETSIDFGTHYLRQMSDRFSGQVEKVLAAYNAGPHRVDAWTAQRGERPAEEFIEGIPFSETRTYVMIVLANREQYRRLYGLDRAAPAPPAEGARP